jgi:hypothetical protein
MVTATKNEDDSLSSQSFLQKELLSTILSRDMVITLSVALFFGVLGIYNLAFIKLCYFATILFFYNCLKPLSLHIIPISYLVHAVSFFAMTRTSPSIIGLCLLSVPLRIMWILSERHVRYYMIVCASLVLFFEPFRQYVLDYFFKYFKVNYTYIVFSEPMEHILIVTLLLANGIFLVENLVAYRKYQEYVCKQQVAEAKLDTCFRFHEKSLNHFMNIGAS